MNSEKMKSFQKDTKRDLRQDPVLVDGGLFVVFEGIDGTGKSTQLQLLTERMQRYGFAVVSTREPTDGRYGKQIRELFVNRGKVTQDQELDLFIADRDEHVRKVIGPALEGGCVVICDRYYLSTVAYQGANGMDIELIMDKNKGFPVPDLAIILEIEPAESINRIRNHRNEKPNTFEEESNLRKVAAIFTEMNQPYIRRINGADSIENIHQQVVKAVEETLSHKRLKRGEA
jgi:dTMP kinase